jgi:hypothetical protein
MAPPCLTIVVLLWIASLCTLAAMVIAVVVKRANDRKAVGC